MDRIISCPKCGKDVVIRDADTDHPEIQAHHCTPQPIPLDPRRDHPRPGYDNNRTGYISERLDQLINEIIQGMKSP